MSTILKDEDLKKALSYLTEAANIAKEAMCESRACGTVIVSTDNKVIATKFNAPPAGLKSQKRCNTKHLLHKNFKSDKTCCVHAEQRAIIEALSKTPQKLKGATLYFSSVDVNGKYLTSGKPYCTICSKMALEVGISYWVLDHTEGGITKYNAEEYNDISFASGES